VYSSEDGKWKKTDDTDYGKTALGCLNRATASRIDIA
jgi:hypothetical protein